MTTKVSSKGQIVLPAELRRADAIEPGQVFEVERIDTGEYLLRRAKAAPNAGLVDWLLDCPVKGFIPEPLPTESTETIRPGIS